MKELKSKDVELVSGGDYQLTINAHVASEVGGWVSNIFSGIVNGTIMGTDEFIMALENAVASGADFDGVRIDSIQFNGFN